MDEHGTTKERGATVPLSVRFTSDELERLREEADQAGMPVSAFVRRFALARQDRQLHVAMSSNNVASNAGESAAPTGIELSGYTGGFSASVR